jgi:hypothetical protein
VFSGSTIHPRFALKHACGAGSGLLAARVLAAWAVSVCCVPSSHRWFVVMNAAEEQVIENRRIQVHMAECVQWLAGNTVVELVWGTAAAIGRASGGWVLNSRAGGSLRQDRSVVSGRWLRVFALSSFFPVHKRAFLWRLC